jgi:sigma-B regulation protein RsbU (phosphoserine phosphatase)
MPMMPQAFERVLRVLERLAASSDLEEVLGLVIDAMRDCLHAERASVFQYDPATEELFITQAHGVAAIRFPITRGIAGEVARTRTILNIPDCYADPRFNPEIDRKTGFRTRNMLTIPLVSFDGGLEGVAQVLNKDPSRGQAFDAADEALARALASQAAIAMRRAKLIAAEMRKTKLEADLDIARTIQRSSWPKQIPEIPGYQIAASAVPAEETGGDAYDLFIQPGGEVSEGRPPAVLFALGDATGHGIGPAISVAQFRAMFRMGVRLRAGLPEVAAHINSQLCEDLPLGRFVTAFFGRLDPVGHQIEWVSMGQAPMFLVRSGAAIGTGEAFDASGMPLGVDSDSVSDPVEPLKLNPGDVFVLLSDGYYEARNPEGELFGEGRVLEVVGRYLDKSAQQILEAVRNEAISFARGRAFEDDQTGIIIKRCPE